MAARSFPDYNDIGEFEDEMGAGHFEPNDGFLSGRTTNPIPNQCPLILSMEKRCRGVDLLSGDMEQELLPVCGIHQICYLCVSFTLHSFLQVIQLMKSRRFRERHNRPVISNI